MRERYFHFQGKPHEYPDPPSLEVVEVTIRKVTPEEFAGRLFYGASRKQVHALGACVRILHKDELPKRDKFSMSGGAYEFGPPRPRYGVITAVRFCETKRRVVYDVVLPATDPQKPTAIEAGLEAERLLPISSAPSSTDGDA